MPPGFKTIFDEERYRYGDGYDDGFLLVLANSHFSVNRFASGIKISIPILDGYRCHSDDGGDVDDGDDDDFFLALAGVHWSVNRFALGLSTPIFDKDHYSHNDDDDSDDDVTTMTMVVVMMLVMIMMMIICLS